MDAAVGEQSHQVKRAAALPDLGQRLGENGIVVEGAVLDALGDAGQVLVDDAAGADIQVAHLGVAHLAVGQADIRAGGAELRHRVIAAQGVEARRLGQAGGIVLAGGFDTPPVEDDQGQGPPHAECHSSRSPWWMGRSSEGRALRSSSLPLRL